MPVIRLAAPTGKAAARLKESIQEAWSNLDCSCQVKTALSQEVCTLHRLLKPIPGSPYFRHHRDNPLPADIVVIDEASMVDLPLMSKLLQAVPLNSRLIIIGDKDQLVSVEAGSVLGDICGRHVIHGFSDRFGGQVRELTGDDLHQMITPCRDRPDLKDNIVVLRKGYRFAAESDIGKLSRAVKRGEAAKALKLLQTGADPNVVWRATLSPREFSRILAARIVQSYQAVFHLDDPAQALKELNRFKILCALKIGPYGVIAINRPAERVLGQQGLIPSGSGGPILWYPGRPVLIIRNDYALGLFNGDIGVAMPAGSHGLQVFFQSAGGEIRRLSLPCFLSMKRYMP
ncbi:MAG: AAA family ATPase [Desulfobacterales bacterium]|nr:MAG: AAA family ATPase [Desulfobacterales bacterium]